MDLQQIIEDFSNFSYDDEFSNDLDFGRFLRSVGSSAQLNSTYNATYYEIVHKKYRAVYMFVPIFCVILCAIATITNARVLASVFWVKGKLPPTLIISLSLAVADSISAFTTGIGFMSESFLPVIYEIDIMSDCQYLVIEGLRLTNILVTTLHVLVLAGNHYFGILYPFKWLQLATNRNLYIVLGFVWAIPSAFVFGYFNGFPNQGFQAVNCSLEGDNNFLAQSHFRYMYSGFFFVPLVLLMVIYAHITVLVRRHQRNRQWFNRHRRGTGRSGNRPYSLENNLKAITTSVYIISAYVICFMPAVLQFLLICSDCLYTFTEVKPVILISLSCTVNILLIFKYFLNPLIYAARMQEIKMATALMNKACISVLRCQNTNEYEVGLPERPSQRLSLFTTSSKRTNIALTTISVRKSPEQQSKNDDAEVQL